MILRRSVGGLRAKNVRIAVSVCSSFKFSSTLVLNLIISFLLQNLGKEVCNSKYIFVLGFCGFSQSSAYLCQKMVRNSPVL